jgi:uncharacterized protein YydD (DUF2326 family)
MFLKSLRIENVDGLIRLIEFHAGINLIVDETPSDAVTATGNNVGKTTVLMLIDFCLGASAKGIYTDPETKKNEDSTVKDFLTKTEVLITLTLSNNLNDPFAEEIVIERNFLNRGKLIRRVNGAQLTEDDFEKYLTNQLFPGHYGKKPTFRQIISHNIRYKDQGVNNTLKTLDRFSRDAEYETLYLFLLGCNFDDGDSKQNLLAKIRIETAFKARLEGKQTKSAYETSLALLEREIQRLDVERSTFKANPDFESDLKSLDKVRYEMNRISSAISRLTLRRNLILEAVNELKSNAAEIDVKQLGMLYSEVSEHLGGMSRTFSQLVSFHNKMVEEKTRYIQKELPVLDDNLDRFDAELHALVSSEKLLTQKLSESGSFEALEKVIVALNAAHQRKGEYEAIIQQIADVEKSLTDLGDELRDIDDRIFAPDFEALIQERLNDFNAYFSRISRDLYGEEYALTVDKTTSKTGQRIYKFRTFNTNFSSGKKQGEITCFDIAYTLFADDEGIPCYHFLLNDKKELMHGNQLIEIADLVSKECEHVQFVASILKDKLPTELNDEKYFVVKLSQDDKLFRIEAAK